MPWTSANLGNIGCAFSTHWIWRTCLQIHDDHWVFSTVRASIPWGICRREPDGHEETIGQCMMNVKSEEHHASWPSLLHWLSSFMIIYGIKVPRMMGKHSHCPNDILQARYGQVLYFFINQDALDMIQSSSLVMSWSQACVPKVTFHQYACISFSRALHQGSFDPLTGILSRPPPRVHVPSP